jgi:hypothetical protein
MTWNNTKIKVIPSTWLLLIANKGNLNAVYLLYSYNLIQSKFCSCIPHNRINRTTAADVQTARTISLLPILISSHSFLTDYVKIKVNEIGVASSGSAIMFNV